MSSFSLCHKNKETNRMRRIQFIMKKKGGLLMKTNSYLPEVSISFKILLNNLQSSKAALHPVPYAGNCDTNNVRKLFEK